MYIYVYMCVCMYVCMYVCMSLLVYTGKCRFPQNPEECVRCSGARVTGACVLPKADAENGTQAHWKSNAWSQLLSPLSSSSNNFFNTTDLDTAA